MKSRNNWIVFNLIAGTVLAALSFAPLVWADGKKPKYTVKEVMKEIHKGRENIGKRAAEGVASKEDIAKLAEYYESLPLNEPPRGELASWKEKTASLVKASRALNAGQPGAAETYKKAINCKACHTAHKPEEKK